MSPVDWPVDVGEWEAALDGLTDDADLESTARLAERVRLDLALAAAGNVGVWDGDLVRGRIYADANFARIYGVDPEQATQGHPLGHYFGSIHPDDRDAVRAGMTAVLAGQTAELAQEHRIHRPDGTIRWVLARGRVLRDEAGQPVRLSGLSFDVTERRQSEARQGFLLELLDGLRSLGDPTAMLDLAISRLGRHLAANRAGYAEIRPDLRTTDVLCAYAEGAPAVAGTFDIEQFGAGNAARHRQGQTVVHEDLLADPDSAGETFREVGSRGLISVPLMRDGQLRATVWVTTMTPRAWHPGDVRLVEDVATRLWDALERARAERALRQANACLEQRVAAALDAREQVEEALRQSQKMEAIGQLTGGIAHDFNNMLQNVSSAIHLMRRRIEGGRPEEAAFYVETAQAAIERAGALTHRLLAFARRQALAPRRVNVAELVRGMSEIIRRTAGPSIRVELRLASPCWDVECDPNQLESALLNLAINARDAMPASGGTLTLETAQERVDETEFVRLTVRDTGSGMTDDVIAHAFEPFYTTKPMGQGTGLGLSQVYGFVSQSQGLVRLESQVGHGTHVHLYLPRHRVSQTSTLRPQAGTGDAGTDLRARVLLVEDEPDLRGFLAEALTGLGCQVSVAKDGPAGLQTLHRMLHGLDLLMADVGLPGGLNGRQLAEAARALRPNLPILLITGYAGEAIQAGALPDGIEVLGKPFTLEGLAQLLAAMLGREAESRR